METKNTKTTYLEAENHLIGLGFNRVIGEPITGVIFEKERSSAVIMRMGDNEYEIFIYDRSNKEIKKEKSEIIKFDILNDLHLIDKVEWVQIEASKQDHVYNVHKKWDLFYKQIRIGLAVQYFNPNNPIANLFIGGMKLPLTLEQIENRCTK